MVRASSLLSLFEAPSGDSRGPSRCSIAHALSPSLDASSTASVSCRGVGGEGRCTEWLTSRPDGHATAAPSASLCRLQEALCAGVGSNCVNRRAAMLGLLACLAEVQLCNRPARWAGRRPAPPACCASAGSCPWLHTQTGARRMSCRRVTPGPSSRRTWGTRPGGEEGGSRHRHRRSRSEAGGAVRDSMHPLEGFATDLHSLLPGTTNTA